MEKPIFYPKKLLAVIISIFILLGYLNSFIISATGISNIISAEKLVLDGSQNYYIMSFMLDNKVTDSTLMNVQCDPNFSNSVKLNMFINGKSIGDWCLLLGDYGIMIHIYQPSGTNQGRIDIWSHKNSPVGITPNNEISLEIRNNIDINATSIAPVSYIYNSLNSAWYLSSNINGTRVITESGNYYIMRFVLDKKITDNMIFNAQADANYSLSIKQNMFINGKSVGEWCNIMGHDYAAMVHLYPPTGSDQGYIDIWADKGSVVGVDPTQTITFEIKNTIYINSYAIKVSSYIYKPNGNWYKASQINGTGAITESGNYYIMRFNLNRKVTDTTLMNVQADANYSASIKSGIFINGKSIGEWCTQFGHDYAAMIHIYGPQNGYQGYMDIWVDKVSLLGVSPSRSIVFELKDYVFIGNNPIQSCSYIFNPSVNKWNAVSQINNAKAITESGNYYIMRFILSKKVTDTTLMNVQADVNYSTSVKSSIFINGKSVGEWCTQLGHDYAEMIHFYAPQDGYQGYMDIWVDKGSVVGVDPTKTIIFELNNYVFIGNNAIQTVRYSYNPSNSQWVKDSFIRHNPDVIEANVTTDNGVPRLYIDGRVTAPLIFWGNLSDSSNQSIVIDEIAKAKATNVNIISTFVPGIWSPTGAYDFQKFDSYLDLILQANSNAKIILRLPIDLNVDIWESTYPNEKMLYEDNSTGRIAVTSSNMQIIAEQGVAAVIDHVLSIPKYSRSVIGYHVTSGEWFQSLFNSKGIDFSNPTLLAFRTYLSEKYVTSSALQTAWGDSAVTLENVQISTVPMNLGTETYLTTMLLNTTERKYIDYYDFISDIIANRISRISKIIKDKTGNRSLVVAFYGYALELPDPKAGHSALTKVLQDSSIDMLASPMSYYNNRIEKGIGGFMSLVDSVSLHNKIWIVENDLRTTDIQPGEGDSFNPKCASIAAAIEVEKREMGMLLTRNIGTWWMDLYGSGWLSDNTIWDSLNPLVSFYNNYSKNYKGFKPDVAFVVDESSMKMMANPAYTGSELFRYQRDAIYRSGVSFGFYETADIAAGKVPDAKLYVFMNPWDLDEEERAGIISNLETNGKTVMWMNGFGNLSQSEIQSLTGMVINKDSSSGMMNTVLNTANHSINNYLTGKSNVFASAFSNPYYYVNDTSATTLGVYDVVGRTSLASKEINGFKSVFYGGLKLSPDLIRAVAKYAGINVFSESNDTFSSNNDFIMLHSNLAGNKTINFATNCDVYDYFQGTWHLNVNSVTVNMQEGITKYFLFGSKSEIETKYFSEVLH